MAALLVAALLGAVASPAQGQVDATLRRAERSGAQLHELERVFTAAKAAGEEMRAFRRSDRITAWVADRRDGGYRVIFAGEDRQGRPIGLFQVTVAASGDVTQDIHKLDKEPLDGALAAQYFARRLAENTEHAACSTTYMTLALAADEPGATGWQVYLLPTSSFSDVLMVGGSYRMEVSAAGDTVRASQALGGAGCAVLQNPADAAVLQVDAGLGAGPNELHVYLALQARKPLYVVSGDRTWLVRDGRIQLAAPRPQRP